MHFSLLYTTYTITQKYIQLKTKHFQFIQNHLLNHVFTFILSPIIANILSIEIFDNLSLEEYKGPEKSFVLQARLAKKQNIKINLEREDYIVSLKRAIDTISSKCTIYMVEKYFIISGYDNMANHYTYLDFGQFLQ